MSEGPQAPPNPADDDAYRALFRPQEDLQPPDAAALPSPTTPQAPIPSNPATSAGGVLAEAHGPQPIPGTGRLFRSLRADAPATAVPAIAADRAARLRTLTVDEVLAAPQPTPAATDTAEPAPNDIDTAQPAPISTPDTRNAEAVSMSRSDRDPGLTGVGVYVVVIGVTLVAGLLDAFVAGPGPGWLTGIALIAASMFAALRVRTADTAVAVIAPPLAYFITSLTVGQIGQSSSGGFLGRFVTEFFMLASGWVSIIAATLLALIIVIVRGRKRT